MIVINVIIILKIIDQKKIIRNQEYLNETATDEENQPYQKVPMKKHFRGKTKLV